MGKTTSTLRLSRVIDNQRHLKILEGKCLVNQLHLVDVDPEKRPGTSAKLRLRAVSPGPANASQHLKSVFFVKTFLIRLFGDFATRLKSQSHA